MARFLILAVVEDDYRSAVDNYDRRAGLRWRQ